MDEFQVYILSLTDSSMQYENRPNSYKLASHSAIMIAVIKIF